MFIGWALVQIFKIVSVRWRLYDLVLSIDCFLGEPFKFDLVFSILMIFLEQKYFLTCLIFGLRKPIFDPRCPFVKNIIIFHPWKENWRLKSSGWSGIHFFIIIFAERRRSTHLAVLMKIFTFALKKMSVLKLFEIKI